MPQINALVILHCYDTPEDLPEGITLSDAANVLPRARYFADRKTAYPAMFSDLFRYTLMQQTECTYVDCDVYCLKPIPEGEYIFGWESTRFINTAVLKLAPDLHCLAIFGTRQTTPTSFRRGNQENKEPSWGSGVYCTFIMFHICSVPRLAQERLRIMQD